MLEKKEHSDLETTHEITGTFELFIDQSKEKLIGLVSKDNRTPDVHLSPDPNNPIDFQTVKTLTEKINLSSHNKFIKAHAFPTTTGWRVTIEPLNGVGTLEYLTENLNKIICVKMPN